MTGWACWKSGPGRYLIGPVFLWSGKAKNLFDNVVPSNYSESSSIVRWNSLSPLAGSAAKPAPAFFSGGL